MKHQIIPISKDLATIYLGIKELAPDMLHLIVTEQNKHIIKDMLELLPKSIQVKQYITEFYDGEDIERICQSIHESYPQDEIMYNLSGSRKIMLIAGCKTAFTHQRDNNPSHQRDNNPSNKCDNNSLHKCNAFIISQENQMIMLPTYEKRELIHHLDNEEFIAIYGENLSSYSDLDELKKEDIVCAHKIKNFIETHYDEYSKIKKQFRRSNIEDFSKIEAKYSAGDGLEFELKLGKLNISKKGKSIFSSGCPNTAFLFFLGRWWETLVAQQIKYWSDIHQRDNDIWQSVVFTSEIKEEKTKNVENKYPEPVKNEIDILVNDDSRLLIIECKSGYISQNNIYKIDSVRETYGGDKSKAILISYYPLDEALQEKCEDLDVLYFAPNTYEERHDNLKKLAPWLNEMIK